MKRSQLNHSGTVNTENRRRSVFLFSVFSASLWCNWVSASEPPIVGRPAEFAGAIGGPFAVTTSVEPQDVTVEQPAILTLRIVGPGNLKDIQRPALAKMNGFKPFAVDDLDDGFTDGSPPIRTFRYRLRARTAGISEVPAIRFVYFNPAIIPASRGYQTTYSPPLPLTVRALPNPDDALPMSIAAMRRELTRDPSDSALRMALEEARDRVAYPSPDLRPRRDNWPYWLTLPRLGWLSISVLLIALTLLRRWIVVRRNAWLVGSFVLMLVAAIPVIGTLLEWRERARNEAMPIVVLERGTELRRGNGEDYPPRIEAPLPAGAEVRRLFERPGWLQVELANGDVGWLRAQAIMPP